LRRVRECGSSRLGACVTAAGNEGACAVAVVEADVLRGCAQDVCGGWSGEVRVSDCISSSEQAACVMLGWASIFVREL
jgi:hypothetical protein